MVKVNKVFFCPECEFEIRGADVDECPNCGREFTSHESKFFTSPIFLCRQLESHEQNLHLGSIKEQRDFEKVELENIYKDYRLWLRKCSHQDKLASLKDSLLIMQNLIHTSATPEVLRALTSIGKKIGKLSEAIDNYFGAGGELNDTEYSTRMLQTAARNDPRYEASAVGRGDQP
jgi:hypothetical protein